MQKTPVWFIRKLMSINKFILPKLSIALIPKNKTSNTKVNSTVVYCFYVRYIYVLSIKCLSFNFTSILLYQTTYVLRMQPKVRPAVYISLIFPSIKCKRSLSTTCKCIDTPTACDFNVQFNFL